MNPKKNRNILLYSDTARSADALHFGGVAMHDPFIALSARGRKYAVVSALEFGRVKRHSDFGTVLPLEAWLEKARRAWPRRSPGPALVVALLARELKAGPFTVPDDFPAGLYRELCGLGLRIRISAGGPLPGGGGKLPPQAAPPPARPARGRPAPPPPTPASPPPPPPRERKTPPPPRPRPPGESPPAPPN